MNFFDVEMHLQGKRIWLRSDQGLALPLASDDFPALSAYAGRRLTLGCRPEALKIGDPLAQPHLRGTLVYSENLGAESNLFVQTDNGAQYSVKQHVQQHYTQGRPLAITLNTSALHFFDPQSGERLPQ